MSSEAFYETDPTKGYKRGFSVQTVTPLPIAWAEHVATEGHRVTRCADRLTSANRG